MDMKKKFIKKKLYGGRLKDDIKPKENTNKNNKFLFLYNKVNLLYENILILIFFS